MNISKSIPTKVEPTGQAINCYSDNKSRFRLLPHTGWIELAQLHTLVFLADANVYNAPKQMLKMVTAAVAG